MSSCNRLMATGGYVHVNAAMETDPPRKDSAHEPLERKVS